MTCLSLPCLLSAIPVVCFIMTSCIITWHAYFIILTISKTKGIYICSVLQIMASVRRNTIRVNFMQIPAQLKELASRVSETSTFIKRHGQLLSLVTSKLDEEMMSVLFQFFDPVNHCFTFQITSWFPLWKSFLTYWAYPSLSRCPSQVWKRLLDQKTLPQLCI